MNYDEQDLANAEKLVGERQFFLRRPKKSADVIAQLMARKGYGQQQSADELTNAWKTIASESWQNQTAVSGIRRGVLEIIVSNSMLNQRLEFDKKRLLEELRSQLPQNNLKDIRFRIGNTKIDG